MKFRGLRETDHWKNTFHFGNNQDLILDRMSFFFFYFRAFGVGRVCALWLPSCTNILRIDHCRYIFRTYSNGSRGEYRLRAEYHYSGWILKFWNAFPENWSENLLSISSDLVVSLNVCASMDNSQPTPYYINQQRLLHFDIIFIHNSLTNSTLSTRTCPYSFQ